MSKISSFFFSLFSFYPIVIIIIIAGITDFEPFIHLDQMDFKVFAHFNAHLGQWLNFKIECITVPDVSVR